MGLLSYLFPPPAPTQAAPYMALKRYYNECDYIPTDYVVIDTETSGLDACTCEILEVCAIHYRDGKELGRFHSYVRPVGAIPREASRINGITWRRVYSAPLLDEIRQPLLDLIGDNVLVGHNIGFDVKFLQTRLDVTMKNPCFDTLRWSRYAFPERKQGYALDDLRLNVYLEGTPHTAEGDCIATHYLLKMIRKTDGARAYEAKRRKVSAEQARQEHEADLQRQRTREEKERLQAGEVSRAEANALSKLMTGSAVDYLERAWAILQAAGAELEKLTARRGDLATICYGWQMVFGVKTSGQMRYIVIPIRRDRIVCDYKTSVATRAEFDLGTRIFVQSPDDLETLAPYIAQAYEEAREKAERAPSSPWAVMSHDATPGS